MRLLKKWMRAEPLLNPFRDLIKTGQVVDVDLLGKLFIRKEEEEEEEEGRTVESPTKRQTI